MQPLYERILIKPLPDKMPDVGLATQQAQLPRGEVIARGNGRLMHDGKLLPLRVKVGQVVLYDRQKARRHFDLELITENDVFGIEGDEKPEEANPITILG